MKRLLAMLLGSLAVVLLVFSPGDSAYAAGEEVCACHDVTFILGVERNKIVSDFLKSEEFKNLKKSMEQSGTVWSGADAIEIVRYNINGFTIVGTRFVDQKGIEHIAGYSITEKGFSYQGITPEM